jgi:hypothetical protein
MISQISFAVKRFDLSKRQAFDDELRVIQQLLQSNARNENIMFNEGGLETDDELYILFSLAECDLWQYFIDSKRRPPTNPKEKAPFIHSAMGWPQH